MPRACPTRLSPREANLGGTSLNERQRVKGVASSFGEDLLLCLSVRTIQPLPLTDTSGHRKKVGQTSVRCLGGEATRCRRFEVRIWFDHKVGSFKIQSCAAHTDVSRRLCHPPIWITRVDLGTEEGMPRACPTRLSPREANPGGTTLNEQKRVKGVASSVGEVCCAEAKKRSTASPR